MENQPRFKKNNLSLILTCNIYSINQTYFSKKTFLDVTEICTLVTL